MVKDIITTLSEEELTTLIESAIKRTLNTSQEVSTTEIISREELCKRLKITEPTAIRWGKKGKIPFFCIGSNVRYNWQKVLDSLENQKPGKK